MKMKKTDKSDKVSFDKDKQTEKESKHTEKQKNRDKTKRTGTVKRDYEAVANQAIPIILGAVSVFLIFCLFAPSSSGKFGQSIYRALRGAFAFSAYLIPFFLILSAVTWRRDRRYLRRIFRLVFAFLSVLAVSASCHMGSALAHEYSTDVLYSEGRLLHGGGMLGGSIGYMLLKFFGGGGWIFTIAATLLYFFVFFGTQIRRFTIALVAGVKSLSHKYVEKRKDALAEYAKDEAEKKQAQREEEELQRAKRRAVYGIGTQNDRVLLERESSAKPILPTNTPKHKRLFALDDEELLNDNSYTGMREENAVSSSVTRERIGGRRIDLDDDEPNVPKISDDDFDISEIDEMLSPLNLRSKPSKKAEKPAEDYTIGTSTVGADIDSIGGFANITEYADADVMEKEAKIPDDGTERINDRSFYDYKPERNADSVSYTEQKPYGNSTDTGRQATDSSRFSDIFDDSDETDNGVSDSERNYSPDININDSADFSAGKNYSSYNDSSDKNSSENSSAYGQPKNSFEYGRQDDANGEIKVTKSRLKEKERETPKYVLPPLTLLEASLPPINDNSNYEIQKNAEILVQTFENLKLPAKVVNITKGPRITRYELTTDQTIDVKRYGRALNNIAMNLATNGIRIETPIPGKSTVGVEVPNKTASLVHLRDMLDTDKFRNSKSKTTICVGADVTGEPVYGDIAKMPHMLIAGATGMGKSVCINIIISSILYKAAPDEVKLILIDPKKVEFNVYRGIPHLLVPVVTDVKKAAGALSWAVNEMERRYDLIEEAGVRNIDGYNEYARNRSGYEVLPKLVIIIDELNDLMMSARDTVEASIMRITQKARAAGIHLIIGTQRPSVNVITGVIKANIPSRIAFKVTSNVDSRTIFESPEIGAEKLLSKGDMLYFPVGNTSPMRVQGAFMSDSEVEAVVNFIRDHTAGAEYDNDIWNDIESEAKKFEQTSKHGGEGGETSSKKDLDSMLANDEFRRAVEFAVNAGEISASRIQTELEIGFQKASRFITYMQNFGIVSEPNGQKPRKVLIDRNQFIEMLNNMENAE